ncbi:hypothetical protein KPC_2943 [Acinetobacter stercoris]|uniref:Uncharacterized protein n=2 Tax=Acinetobacter stercoris TaxID=2126983 RepID=A0A2U3N2D1_9GAMM|nr:hypothetical protein KPC_2943 [Acinetobacter stercoris]
MNLKEKQTKWSIERPLFEAEFIHSHLLSFFNFNENTGDYEIKNEYENDADRQLAYDTLNTGWVMWLRAKRQIVPEGFVLLPKELNEELTYGKYCDALEGAFDCSFCHDGPMTWSRSYNELVKQFLAADESQEPHHDSNN